jgi:hypothetical protein
MHKIGSSLTDSHMRYCSLKLFEHSLEFIHRDPFDRLLVAQSKSNDMTIITIDENIKKYTTDGCIQVIGNQGDPAFWDEFLKEYPEIDIFLDDGSHHCQHQILTLEKAWPAVKLDGVYMCEDTHTNYWPEYGGGLKTPSTFLNYAKMVSDTLNSAYYRDLDKHPDNMMFADFYKEVVGMHFYDSVVVLDKGQREIPYNVMSTPYEQ